MIEVSPRVVNLLEKTTKFEIFAEVLMDIEVNGYYNYTVDFPESIEPTMFPAEEVLKSRRPAGGLPKLVTPFGKISSTTINDLCYEKSQNWYRLPSKDSNYKYYRSKAVSDLEAPFGFESPLEFIVEYDEPIRLNKLVVGFEYSTCLPDSVEVFFYSNDAWVSVGEFSVGDDGLLALSYDGSWVAADKYSYDFTTTSKIKLTVESMQAPGGAVEIIQISPKMSVDISDRIISVNSSQESQEVSVVSPIGLSASNSGGLEVSNNDGFFDVDNQSSPLSGLVDVNVKFTIKDMIAGDGEDFETVPSAVLFANSWNFQSTGTISVDCSDRAKFLQSRSMENSFYANRDIRFVIADIIERAEIVDYKLCFTQEDVDQATPYFFFQDEQTVWEALQQIATAEQSFFYFDQFGRFVWISRDYWWDSDEVDFEILSRSDGEKLPNLESYSVEYTNIVNKVTVNYIPTDILKQGDRFVNNFLWEQSEPLVLTASPLLSDIDEDSEFFLIDPLDFVFFPEEGIVNIDAEYIKYSKKPRNVVGNAQSIENTLVELIDAVDFAVEDAAAVENIEKDDVEILYVQRVIWPDTSIGLKEAFRQYSRILVEGFFLLLSVPGENGARKVLQYNASLTRNPFLAAVLTSEESEGYSYWKIVEDGEEPQVEFTEASGLFVPPNAMYIEERGVFNSSPVTHSFGAGDGATTFTYKNDPVELTQESPRIVYDDIENSKLRLRINTIDQNLVHHYSPNKPGKYDVYGAQFEFPLFFEQDDIGYDGQGIAGMFINRTGINSGYYIEFTNSVYSRLTLAGKREVSVWKIDNQGRKLLIAGFLPEDIFLLSLEQLIQVSGKPTDIFPGIPQKVSVFVEETQALAAFVSRFGELTNEVNFAIDQVSERFGVDKEDIFVDELAKVDWGSAALGWPEEDVFYSQVIVPGYVIVLAFFDGEDENLIEYRGRDGSMPTTEEDRPSARPRPAGSSEYEAGEVNFSSVGAVELEALRQALDRFDGEDSDPEVPEQVNQVVEGIIITISVNGRRVLSAVEYEIDGNIIYKEGDWGVFARSNTSVDFEYIYAIDRLGDTSDLDKAMFAIRDQVSGGYIDNTLEYFLDENNELRNQFVFEDFGGFARQIVEIDVNHEIVPAASSELFASNESKIYFVYRKLDQFSSKFAIGNRTRDFVVVAGDDPVTQTNMVLSVYGVPLNSSESEDIKKINEKSVWRRGEEEVIIDSPWIQTKEKAQRIADWTVQRWSQPSEFVEAQLVFDSRLELGDLVTISVPENSITPETHKFHVVSITKSVGETTGMTLRLRRAQF